MTEDEETFESEDNIQTAADNQVGEDVFYTFNSSTGALTLTGTGATYNYDASEKGKTPFAAIGNESAVLVTADFFWLYRPVSHIFILIFLSLGNQKAIPGAGH